MRTLIVIVIVVCAAVISLNVSAQNAPISSIGNIETLDDTAQVSITVADFTNIGACDLKIVYDSTIAKATSVTLAPGVEAFFFVTSVDTLGKIYVSWLFFQYGVPGLTLPDNSIFLNINFDRVGFGNTDIEFDNSSPDNCLFTDENYDLLNDIPYSTYYIDGSLSFNMVDAPVTYAPFIEGCEGLSNVEIPITVSSFNEIGAFTLSLQYDTGSLLYQSFLNDSGFPEMDVVENDPGTIVVNGISESLNGVTLADNSILFTLEFEVQGGASDLTWNDTGESCFYQGPAPAYEPRNDNPQSSFYVDGNYNEIPLPLNAGTINGPAGGLVCQGENGVAFSVLPIGNADSYEWTLPFGASISSGAGTSEIFVSFDENAESGNINVYGVNECGNGTISPDFFVFIEEGPAIINQPVTPDTVYAGNGVASFTAEATGLELTYQWQEFIDEWADLSNGGFYSGVLSPTLTITNPIISMNGYKYRCIVSGFCEPPAITNGNAQLIVVLYTGLNNDYLNGVVSQIDLSFKSFPNPFNDQVLFTYTIPAKGHVRIEIVDIAGEIILELNNEIELMGNYKTRCIMKQLKPGIYTATITYYNEESLIRNTLKIIARSD